MKTPQSPAPVAGEEDAIILEMCKAHDREESAQKGEPSPWDERFERDFDWEQERFFAMREAFDVAKVALSRPASEQPVEAIGAGREALADIAAERRRQVETEGWTPEHDDQHGNGSMAVAAACYAMFASVSDQARKLTAMPASLTVKGKDIPGWSAWLSIWPWERSWWKPKDRRRDLVRAGALIVAEIERLDRKEAAK